MPKATCKLSEKVPTGTEGIYTYYFRCTWDKYDTNTYTVSANGADEKQALALALERVPFEPDRPHGDH